MSRITTEASASLDHIIPWLLEEENPSVRYFALTRLLDRALDDPEVQKAQRAIMDRGVVFNILKKQNEDGSWGDPMRFYRDKYKGTVWTLLILAELHADGDDPGIRKACEFILAHAQEAEEGGFSYDYSAKQHGGLLSGVIPCLTGNMAYSLIELGMLNDLRVKKAIRWITTYQRADDKETTAPKGYPYDRYPMCWGSHSCHMGVAKTLKALTAVPEEDRTAEINRTIEKLAEYFLIHHIHKKSHDLAVVSRPGWLKFGFPLMYQTDVLELLLLFKRLKIQDPRLEEARAVLISKRREDGTWNLENTFNGKMQATIEQKGKPSKWITLRALEVLKEQ